MHPPLSSAASTAAGAQDPPSSPNHRSPADAASLLQLLASPLAGLSSASPCLRKDADLVEIPSPDLPSATILGTIQSRIPPAAVESCPASAPAAQPRLRSLIVAPDGWAAPSSVGCCAAPRLHSIIVAPEGGLLPDAALPAAAGQQPATGSGDAAAEDSSLGWQQVRSRKEKRNPQAPVLGDPRQGRQGRRAPPSDPMALKQHLAFKARLRGKCFRCLSKRHRLADCREPLRCIRCKGIGHFARTCSASLP